MIKNETVGSCATLIAELLLQMETPKNLDPDMLNLLRWTILLDTVNLSTEHKKATPKDIVMLEKLEEILDIGDPISDRKTIFETMSRAKSDTSSFTCYQLFRKDLKVCDLKSYSARNAFFSPLALTFEMGTYV